VNQKAEILTELATGFTAGLELLLNSALKLDPESLESLQSFDGKVIQIKLLGLELDFYLQVSPQGIMLMNQYAGEADTILAGRPLKFAEMALGDAQKVLFSGDVTITGDVELGQNFKRWIDKLDIDWEEQLSTVTGDVVAHNAGNLIRSTTAWGLQALTILSQNTADYLKQESEQLPLENDMADFVNQVDEFRDSVARLEARLSKLLDTSSV
jgi:ubiquinone biosynthesis protein UbiJ